MQVILIIVLFILAIIVISVLNEKSNQISPNPPKCREQTYQEIEIESDELKKMEKKKLINYSCSIAGLQHHELYRCHQQITINSKVIMVHECNNPFDYFAVAIYFQKFMLGYVPAKECARIAVRLKKGVKFEANIESIYKNVDFSYSEIRVRIKEIRDLDINLNML